MTWLPRTTWNFCSCSIRLCRPRNCFSFDQSLKAVTSTTHTTDNRMAAPSIQPASASPSSSTPPAAEPQAGVWKSKHTYRTCQTVHLEASVCVTGQDRMRTVLGQSKLTRLQPYIVYSIWTQFVQLAHTKRFYFE